MGDERWGRWVGVVRGKVRGDKVGLEERGRGEKGVERRW